MVIEISFDMKEEFVYLFLIQKDIRPVIFYFIEIYSKYYDQSRG